MLVANLVIRRWSKSNSLRVAWSHVTQDSSGKPLFDHRHIVYRNASTGIVRLGMDSIGGTTDSTFVDNNANELSYFCWVRVKAGSQDRGGMTAEE